MGYCKLPSAPDYSKLEQVFIEKDPAINDYLQAMSVANKVAEDKLGEAMQLSWYDRDRDFESPQHASECHMNSAIPGYVDYALYRDASLRVVFEDERFVFFYLKI
ncbi:AF1514 family protein [Candidatus Venteria ishoeyi]|uniref:AF1514 family protein n=1 Tax=Candidatus Venteria ishoeyi TaxID=1899563 RepID=UPI0025A60D36|nr:AF1514 family protein [Candidatus Venteria ishoeyi]MDM8546094.1 AF1514 family protein [Candidatus Venteria ishoeyi]